MLHKSNGYRRPKISNMCGCVLVVTMLAIGYVWIGHPRSLDSSTTESCESFYFEQIWTVDQAKRVAESNRTNTNYTSNAGNVVPTPFIDKYRAISIQSHISNRKLQDSPPPINTSCPTVISAPTSDWVDGPEPQRWQPVSADSNDAFVFSAFFDTRWAPHGRVLIIGIATEYDKGGARSRYCRVWFKDNDRSTTVEAHFRFVPETHDRKYAAVLFTCHVTPKTPGDIPYAVSLVDDVCQTNASNLLHVLYNDPSAPPEVDFTVCMSVLHSGFDDHFRLIEAVEANRMFGAERFVIYDHEAGSNIRQTLSGYVRNGVGVVISWNSLPVKSFTEEQPGKDNNAIEVHYYGQVAAVNDCLYRNLFRSTFIFFADIDEILVPRGRSESWLAVLEQPTARWAAMPHNRRFPGAYVVRNAFFRSDRRQMNVSASYVSCPPPLKSLTTLTREQYIYPENVRSKYFVWSKAAVVVGIHFPYEMALPHLVDIVNVKPEEALLHHYRDADYQFVGEKKPAKIDDHMLHFAAELLRRTEDFNRRRSSR